MSTMNQPEVLVTITPVAGAEVKKFMAAGKRRSGQGRPARQRPARRLQRLQVRPADRRRSRGRRPHRRPGRLARVRRSVLGTVPERRDDRLCLVDAGLRLHVQESELHGRLRLRQLVLGITTQLVRSNMERSVAGTRRDAVVTDAAEARDSTRSRAFSRRSRRYAAHERIRTVVVDDHEDIARLVADAHRDADPRTQRRRASARCSASRRARRRSACTAS